MEWESNSKVQGLGFRSILAFYKEKHYVRFLCDKRTSLSVENKPLVLLTLACEPRSLCFDSKPRLTSLHYVALKNPDCFSTKNKFMGCPG